MKKKLQTALLAVILLAMPACAEREKLIDVSKLPASAQEMLKTHFAGKTVSFVKAERDGLSMDYDVIFDDGSAIDFSAKGEWEEINCRQGDIPTSLVPEKIAKYVEEKYPTQKIRQIERRRRGYEIKLTNGLELRFNKQLQFSGIDD